ncbi:hypothetical protein AMECASPLE_001297 [Ameca splendens]|uniref:Uncharacterized protein n=1 Tax=Ameca splendens TaxID=208324 RepID=A0ABV1A7F7_9TELE
MHVSLLTSSLQGVTGTATGPIAIVNQRWSCIKRSTVSEANSRLFLLTSVVIRPTFSCVTSPSQFLCKPFLSSFTGVGSSSCSHASVLCFLALWIIGENLLSFLP